ncbi:MAG: SUMF1/EgtB/PvdO family nonheme iron enzyme [Methylocystaceae bacterium]|nr:SUMF1/EgtB/PvdO family nonheme iron enzyme [Methylocystaceae bacterium]
MIKYYSHLAIVMCTLFVGSLAYANGPKPTNIEGLESPLPMTVVQAKERMGFGDDSDKHFIISKKFVFTIIDSGFGGLQQWLVQNPEWKAKVSYISLRKGKKRSSNNHGFDVFRTATSVMPKAKFILIETQNHLAQMGNILMTMQKKGSHFASMSLGHREYLGKVSTKQMDAIKAALTKYQFTFLKSAGNYRKVSHNFDYVDRDEDRILEFSHKTDKNGGLIELNKIGIVKNRPSTINLSWENSDNGQSRFELQLLDMDKKIIKTASNESSKRSQILLHYKTKKNEFVYIRVIDKTPDQKSKVKSLNIFAKGTYVYDALMNGQESLNVMSQIESPFIIPVGSFGQNKKGELTPSLFSSIGHTSDGQVSPLVLGPGQLKMENGEVMNGTSFATPFLAALYSVHASYNIKNYIEETTTQKYWADGLSIEEKGRWGVVDGPKFYNNKCWNSNKIENIQHYIEKGKLAFEFDFSRNCMEKLDYYLHAYIRDGRTFAPIKTANGRELLRGWVKKFSPHRNIVKEPVRIEVPFKLIPAKYANKDLKMNLYISTLAQWDPVQVPRVASYKFNLDLKNGPKKAKNQSAKKAQALVKQKQQPISNSTRQTASTNTFKDCDVCPQMVNIPQGKGIMGANPNLTFTALPYQDVIINYPLAVGKYEVTVGQWQSCVNDGGCPDKRFEFARNQNYPANMVSWHDAQTYLIWLNKKLNLTGKPSAYRLLSNSEWEYSARAGVKAKYHCGMMDCLIKTSWHMDNAKSTTHEVGQLKSNTFGLYDMMGNVGEWVQDCWFSGEGDGGTSHGKAYEKTSCDTRVVKGGAYGTSNDDLVPGWRDEYAPSHQSKENGFRVARTLEKGSDR